jgi:hypothetical protein
VFAHRGSVSVGNATQWQTRHSPLWSLGRVVLVRTNSRSRAGSAEIARPTIMARFLVARHHTNVESSNLPGQIPEHDRVHHSGASNIWPEHRAVRSSIVRKLERRPARLRRASFKRDTRRLAPGRSVGETARCATTSRWPLSQVTRRKELRTGSGRFRAKELAKSGELFASFIRELFIRRIRCPRGDRRHGPRLGFSRPRRFSHPHG